MWYEQDAARAHFEQVRVDVVHDLVAALAAGQPRPATYARRARGSTDAPAAGWLLRRLLGRSETSFGCAHAMAHAGGRA